MSETIWDYIEANQEGAFKDIVHLYHWSLNFEAGQTPFTAFLDLIGWSEGNYGSGMYNWGNVTLGYLELDYLADALKIYTDRPQDALQVVERLLELEAEG